ncbi:unnamed protein product [Closterium sp. Naga37s-1]|nr:unnamed protein product [Closterium sp. Naga37s-1]
MGFSVTCGSAVDRAALSARSCAQVPPQAPDSLVKLSRSSSATLRGRSQHGRQQRCELVRRVQARVTLAAAESLRRNHGEGRVSKYLNQQQRVETLRESVESPREHASAEAEVPPSGTEAALPQQHGENTAPTSHHPQQQTPLPQQAEPAADEDGNREEVPRRREQEPAGSKPEAGVRRQAADSRGAQPVEEPQGRARRASNNSGSAPPSPHAPPSRLPAVDLPSSQAGGTPHHRHARGDPSSPPDRRVGQASEFAVGSAVESLAGAETSRAPDGADWPAAGGATDGAGPPVVADAAFDDETDAGAGTSGTEAGGATGAPGTGTGGSATPPAGADTGGSTKRARGTGAAARTEQQPLTRQGDPRVRGEESFQRLLSRASEPAVQGASSPWSPFRAPTEAGRPQLTRRQRALATAEMNRQSPSGERGGRGARRQVTSGTSGGPENGYQAAARMALTALDATHEEDEVRDPSYGEESLPPSEDEGIEDEGSAREAAGRRVAGQGYAGPSTDGSAATEGLAAQTTLALPAHTGETTRTGTGAEGVATAGTTWQEPEAGVEDEPCQRVAGEGDSGDGKNGRAHGETDECAREGSGTQAPSVVQACSVAQKARRQHPQSGNPRRLGTGLAPARPGPLVGWAQQEIPPPQSLHAEAAGAGPSSSAGDEAGWPHETAERVEAEAEDGVAAVEEEQVTVIDRRRGGTARQRLLRERAAEAAAGNPPAGTRRRAPGAPRGRGGRGARGRAGRGGLAAAVAREKARSGPWRERHGRPERHQKGDPMNDYEDDGDEEYMEEEQGDSEDVSLEDEQGIPAGGANRGARGEGNHADANEGESRGVQPSETASKARSPADIADDSDAWRQVEGWELGPLCCSAQPFLFRKFPPKILGVYAYCMTIPLQRLAKVPGCAGAWRILQFLPRLTLRAEIEKVPRNRWAVVEK